MNCESLRNTAKPYLLICAKACESLRNHICECFQNISITAKTYLRKLAKTHAFRTCATLRKHNLRNLVKGVFIASASRAQPHPCSGPAAKPASSAWSFSTSSHVFITIFKPIVAPTYSPLSASPTASLSRYANQHKINTDTQLFQE